MLRISRGASDLVVLVDDMFVIGLPDTLAGLVHFVETVIVRGRDILA